MKEVDTNSERKMNSSTRTTFATARRSNSSSSSESSSDDDGFQIDTSMFEVNFQMDAMKFNNSFQTSLPKFTASGASNPASKQGKNYVSGSENSAKLSEVDNKKPPVPRPTFQAHDLTNYHNNDSLIACPPVQVMDRSRGYDPGRIPASIFERHNGTPLEWSVCSNDSLFSLNLGNTSLSRENANTFGELAMSEKLSKSGELSSFSRIPSIIMEESQETDSSRESFNSENMQGSDLSHTASKSLEERLNEEQNEGKDSLQTPSSKSSKFIVSSLSHGSSANSAQSSTSQVSESQSMRDIPFVECRKKRARSLCYCSNCSWNCSWALCCSWPSCNCKCSTCGWACCNCWNYFTLIKGRSHASPILTETERKCSVEDDIPSQQSSPYEKEPKLNSKCRWRNCCNWFHCFSCSCSCCRWRPSCRWKPHCPTIRCKFCC